MMSTTVEPSCKKASPSPSCGLSSLPDELVINCLSRVSRLNQVALSMTSKSYRSLVLSHEFYETRSQIGYTEDFIYVFIDTVRNTPREQNQLSFILHRVKGKSSENRLISIPSFQIPQCSSLVALGVGIYVIGGYIESAKTSNVSFLDCRTHKWSYVPPMRIARASANVSVFDGKVYVMGGCNKHDVSIWAEVFDPNLKTWSGVNRGGRSGIGVTIKGPEYGTWQYNGIYNFRAEESIWNDLNKRGNCDIERVLYCRDFEGSIMWCEPWSEVRLGRMHWRKVYGLDAMKDSFRFTTGNTFCCGGERADVWDYYMLKHGYIVGLTRPGHKLSISHGNIVIFWSKVVDKDHKRLQIWCTEISVERREGGEIWGNVEWSEHVTTVDHLRTYYECLQSVTVSV